MCDLSSGVIFGILLDQMDRVAINAAIVIDVLEEDLNASCQWLADGIGDWAGERCQDTKIDRGAVDAHTCFDAVAAAAASQ